MNYNLIPITFFSGPMRSGKSTRLFAELQRSSYRKGVTTAFYRPAKDTREFLTRSMVADVKNIEIKPLVKSSDILEGDADIIGIDELHFIHEDIVEHLLFLYTQGKEIYIAGLNLDAFGNPWSSSQKLLCCPEVNVVRCFGSCQWCGGRWATRTYSSSGVNNVVGDDMYETVCFSCWKEAFDKQQALI